MKDDDANISKKVKETIIGKELDLGDRSIFHRLSLIAFFAWVGLGADGLSSSCYGPSEAFLILGEHRFLAVIVAMATAVTIFIISASYSQIIELFPHGGGGYFVASRLLSPSLGMLSGCALMIDYVLTITLSIASGADAIFSMLPPAWQDFKLPTAVAGVLLLTLLNLRGVKESVVALVPVFMVFVATHAFAILYALISHALEAPAAAERLSAEVSATHAELGMAGMLLLLVRAYSMGAGTYTGLEAVSNGLPMLREPRVRTGKRTMLYMAVSLAVTVVGLMLAYVLYQVTFEPGKTLNAVLFSRLSADWPAGVSHVFILLALASEALLLFVAAQTGFLDGPRVMANMALDRWLPTRFSLLSDRLVTQNGILLFGGASLLVMLVSHGNVSHLIVLYSINVFLTFVLSQSGMVRHWWKARGLERNWRKGLLLNGLGLALTGFILISVVVVKFKEGGWITLVVTGLLTACAWGVRRHYLSVKDMVKAFDSLVGRVAAFGLPVDQIKPEASAAPNHSERTAVVLVNGYNGLGLASIINILRYHGNSFKNFVFVQVGVVDAGVFKSARDMDNMKAQLAESTEKYVELMHRHGFPAEAHWRVGTDVVQEAMQILPALHESFPRSVVFAGQLAFEKENFLTRLLHNYQGFSLQQHCFREGIPFMILPADSKTVQ